MSSGRSLVQEIMPYQAGVVSLRLVVGVAENGICCDLHGRGEGTSDDGQNPSTRGDPPSKPGEDGAILDMRQLSHVMILSTRGGNNTGKLTQAQSNE